MKISVIVRMKDGAVRRFEGEGSDVYDWSYFLKEALEMKDVRTALVRVK